LLLSKGKKRERGGELATINFPGVGKNFGSFLSYVRLMAGRDLKNWGMANPTPSLKLPLS